MRVVCENCGASYKISDSKLNKPVNRATCKKCGHKIIIRMPSAFAPTPASLPNPHAAAQGSLASSAPDDFDDEQRTVVTAEPAPPPMEAPEPPPASVVAASAPTPTPATPVPAVGPEQEEEAGDGREAATVVQASPELPSEAPTPVPASQVEPAAQGSETATVVQAAPEAPPATAEPGVETDNKGDEVAYSLESVGAGQEGNESATVVQASPVTVKADVPATPPPGVEPAGKRPVFVAVLGMAGMLALAAVLLLEIPEEVRWGLTGLAWAGCWAALLVGVLGTRSQGLVVVLALIFGVGGALGLRSASETVHHSGNANSEADEPEEGGGDVQVGDQAPGDDPGSAEVDAAEGPLDRASAENDAPESGTEGGSEVASNPPPSSASRRADPPTRRDPPRDRASKKRRDPPKPTPAPKKALPSPKEVLTKTVVDTLLTAPSAVKSCFGQARDEGWSGGRVDVEFKVSPDGDVHAARISSPSSLFDTPLDRCLSVAINKVVFPPFDYSKAVPIRYTYTSR